MLVQEGSGIKNIFAGRCKVSSIKPECDIRLPVVLCANCSQIQCLNKKEQQCHMQISIFIREKMVTLMNVPLCKQLKFRCNSKTISSHILA